MSNVLVSRARVEPSELFGSTALTVFLVSDVNAHERRVAERCARERVSDGVSDMLVSDA